MRLFEMAIPREFSHFSAKYTSVMKITHSTQQPLNVENTIHSAKEANSLFCGHDDRTRVRNTYGTLAGFTVNYLFQCETLILMFV